MPRLPALLMLVPAALAPAATGGCSQVRAHQGYVADIDLVNSIQPGVDTRASVERTLGRPSFVGQFTNTDWYYIARDTRQFAFRTPRPSEQVTLKVSFDAAGTVSAITRSGLEQIASISPSGEETPTLGRQRSFFSELFGNIGSVGAPGSAPGGGGGGGGGGDVP